MIKVAVLGFGIVGSGVVQVLDENADIISSKAGGDITVKYILDVVDFPNSPWKNLLIKDFSVIESDPEVRVVVETIGGIGIAYEFTKRCLAAGKSVVTSNKELVAKKGYELLELARENNANYLFEASVGGGVPIIRPLTQCLAANRIDEIFGIMNGTTNYILTQMIECSESFDNALKDAQKLGFAEQNPTADIEGIDAQNKISILSDLCFGKHVNPESLKTRGITGVSLEDVEIASRAGYKIKLIGRAKRMPEGKIAAYVAPHFVSSNMLISNVSGVMNAIFVRGNAVGETMFYGPGAGSLPTASAVVADVVDAAKHIDTRKWVGWEAEEDGFVTDAALIESRWYIRTANTDDTGEDNVLWTEQSMNAIDVQKLTDGMDVKAIYRILE